MLLARDPVSADGFDGAVPIRLRAQSSARRERDSLFLVYMSRALFRFSNSIMDTPTHFRKKRGNGWGTDVNVADKCGRRRPHDGRSTTPASKDRSPGAPVRRPALLIGLR